jgi:hypothetical protein
MHVWRLVDYVTSNVVLVPAVKLQVVNNNLMSPLEAFSMLKMNSYKEFEIPIPKTSYVSFVEVNPRPKMLHRTTLHLHHHSTHNNNTEPKSASPRKLATCPTSPPV